MNGAAAVPDRKTSTPNSRITTTIGSNHHFLLWLRNCQNSDAMLPPPPPRLDAPSNRFMVAPSYVRSELRVIALRRFAALGLDPVGRRSTTMQAQRVAAQQAEDQRERREDYVEQQRDDHPRNRPADRKRRDHPSRVHIADRAGPHESNQSDCHAGSCDRNRQRARITTPDAQ